MRMSPAELGENAAKRDNARARQAEKAAKSDDAKAADLVIERATRDERIRGVIQLLGTPDLAAMWETTAEDSFLAGILSHEIANRGHDKSGKFPGNCGKCESCRARALIRRINEEAAK